MKFHVIEIFCILYLKNNEMLGNIHECDLNCDVNKNFENGVEIELIYVYIGVLNLKSILDVSFKSV